MNEMISCLHCGGSGKLCGETLQATGSCPGPVFDGEQDYIGTCPHLVPCGVCHGKGKRPMTRAALKTKCEQLAPTGCVASMAVLELFAELAAKDDLIRQQCDRIDAQAELLRRRAEK
jgi:hypothetical protein